MNEDDLVWIPNPAGLGTVMDGDTEIVTDIGYPWGVRCSECNVVIESGEALVHVPSGYKDIDHPICMACAVTQAVWGLDKS